MDPEALVVLGAGVLGAIGLLRRGVVAASEPGRRVTAAGFSAASPLLRAAQRLPWPLRPISSTMVTLSTMVATTQVALVADGASTLFEAARRPVQRDPSLQRGTKEPSTSPAGAGQSSRGRAGAAAPKASGAERKRAAKKSPASRRPTRATTKTASKSRPD